MIENIKTVVVVAGAQRSGTTLVGQILGAHPDAFLIDEPDGLYTWFDAATQGKLTPEQERRVFQKAARKYPQGDRLLQTDDGPALAPNITHLVLKAPNLTHRYEELSLLGKPVSVVFPVRDPRAVVASMSGLRHVQPNMAEHQKSYFSSRPQLEAEFADELAAIGDPSQPLHVKQALVWRMKTMMYERIRAAGLSVLTFRYEDLVSDREPVIAAMASHVGLDLAPSMLAHEAVYEGVGPGLTDRQRPIDSWSKDAWQTQLSPSEVEDIVKVAGREMEALGYGTAPSAPAAPAVRADISDEMLASPIVFVGRGGSGTRLISTMAQQGGIFLGNRMNRSADSMEWTDLIYKMALASLAEPGEREPTENWDALLRERAAQVLGASGVAAGAPWGWKLPETMLILPEVCRAFDASKVVHLVRHPITSSLRRTHKTSREEDKIGRHVVRAAYAAAGQRVREWRSKEDWQNNAVTWLYQVEKAMEFGRTELGPDRYMEVRYEDLCSDPVETWRAIAGFLGIPFREPVLSDLSAERMGSIDPDDPRGKEVWDLCGGVAAKLGYEMMPANLVAQKADEPSAKRAGLLARLLGLFHRRQPPTGMTREKVG